MRVATRSSLASPLAVALLAASVVAGMARCASPGPIGRGWPVADTSSVLIVRHAQELYDFGRERPPVEIRDTAFRGPVTDDSMRVPRLSIATATRRPGVVQQPYEIIARIRSDIDYLPMGLHAGDNYIWRKAARTADAKSWVTAIVSERDSTGVYRLRRDPRLLEFTHGAASEPRLVRITVHSWAIAACLSDPVCTSGHCGYW